MVSKEMRDGLEVEVDRREPLAAVAGQRRRLSTSAAMLPSFRSHLAPRSPRPARAVRSAVRALSPESEEKKKEGSPRRPLAAEAARRKFAIAFRERAENSKARKLEFLGETSKRFAR